jgi:glycosyltransferase involved in cell wall biosynthesis
MRVAVDLRVLAEGSSRSDWGSWSDLLNRAAKEFPEIEVIEIHPEPPSMSPWSRFRLEQLDLPREAERRGADMLFVSSASAPVRSRVPVLAAGWPAAAPRHGAIERIRWSAGQAGLRAARAWLVFADEVPPDRGERSVPPTVATAFRGVPSGEDASIRSRLGLPEAYVLSLAPPSERTEFGLAAWTWVDGSVGESIPWVIAGIPSGEGESLRARARQLDAAESLRLFSLPSPQDLPAVYRGAQAYLHIGGEETMQSLRWALATGIPVASVDSERAAAVLGEGAYLVPDEDSRALGAACLTLLVEPEVADSLRRKGLQRAAAYHGAEPQRALRDILVEVGDRMSARHAQGGTS